MVDGGLVEETDGQEAGSSVRRYDAQRRRYYRLTGFGQRVLATELGRLEGVVRTARAMGLYPPDGRGVTSPGGA
jgi:hypothetical protein